MPTRLATSSRMDPEFRPTRAALRKRPSGRSRLQQDDPSTISSPAQAAADPDKAGRPRSDRNPHNHSPPTLTSTRIQIRDPLVALGKLRRRAVAEYARSTRLTGLSPVVTQRG